MVGGCTVKYFVFDERVFEEELLRVVRLRYRRVSDGITFEPCSLEFPWGQSG